MNFFEAQDDARRRSKWLVLYFILAIIGIVIALYAAILAVMLFTGVGVDRSAAFSFWVPQVFIGTLFTAGGLIGGGSLFKTVQLNGGGAVVARDMGARQVDPHTQDTAERRLINIVEEMSIASGLPAPQIWIMDNELGINAFAAGTEPGNAVVAVTRGCLQRLTRSELQGVVAHEFSHILNGDMKLNIRLMGLLFGILMISIVGRTMFEALQFVRIRGGSRDDKGGGAAIIIAIVALAVSFLIIGSIGVFFARMIQAAISRQREYLADASAVQFTREADGIAGALKKIGGQQYGSDISSPKAAEAGHLFFADGGMFSYGLATHPPLDIRIRALSESWDGEFITTEMPEVAHEQNYSQGPRQHDSRMSGFTNHHNDKKFRSLGESDQINLSIGSAIRSGLDPELINACHDREQAQALIFGLLLAEDNKLLKGEISFVHKSAGKNASKLALQWNKKVSALHSSQKIALIDISIPTLRKLSLPEYQRFIEITQWLIASDGHVDLFEFMMQHVIQRHLDTHFKNQSFSKIKYKSLDSLQNETNALVTTISALGGTENHQAAYSAAVEESPWKNIQILPPSECGLKDLDNALQKFEHSTPLVKKQLLRLCGLAVMHDGVIDSQEAELIRAIADAIGCTVPPFVRQAG